MFLTANIWISFKLINSSSVKRVIGHAADESVCVWFRPLNCNFRMITLFLQGRLAQIKVEEEYITVGSKNIITIHKEPNKFVKLCGIIITNLVAFFKSFFNVFKNL